MCFGGLVCFVGGQGSCLNLFVLKQDLMWPFIGHCVDQVGLAFTESPLTASGDLRLRE